MYLEPKGVRWYVILFSDLDNNKNNRCYSLIFTVLLQIAFRNKSASFHPTLSFQVNESLIFQCILFSQRRVTSREGTKSLGLMCMDYIIFVCVCVLHAYGILIIKGLHYAIFDVDIIISSSLEPGTENMKLPTI